MFYKPSFCCECGEKIDKENHKWWESRRFCHDCAAHYDKFSTRIVKYSVVPIVFAGIGLLGGNSIAERKPPAVLTQNQPVAAASPQIAKPPPIAPQQQNANSTTAAKPTVQTAPQTLAAARPPAISNLVQTTEVSYYCGARTQKGTPCTRRVRGGGRCWQHVGKPAMLPPEKLKIAQ